MSPCFFFMWNTSMVSFDGGSASKVDDVTALPSRHKMADVLLCNVMTTTMSQHSDDVFYIFNSTVIDWTCFFFIFPRFLWKLSFHLNLSRISSWRSVCFYQCYLSVRLPTCVILRPGSFPHYWSTFNFYVIRMWCLDAAARMQPRISRVDVRIVPFFWWMLKRC